LKAIILSRFDPVYGSKIFLKTSDTLNEEELMQIPQLMAIPSKGFFIHVFENLKTANLFFKLPSKFARGRFEKLLISIITDINNDLNLALSRELLESFATSLLNLKDAYKAFDIEMKDYKGDPEKLSEIEKLISVFYITIKPAIKALEISEQNLKERVKELTCIYGISKLSEDPNITINNILQGTLELIPSAYQFPKITCARIIYDNKEYMTENFADTHWTQMVTKEILEKILIIQVKYLEDKSFLKEEKDLINDIGNRLKVIIEQKEEEKIIKSEKKYLEDIMESMIDGVIIINMEGKIVSINEATISQHGYTREETIGHTLAEVFFTKEEIPKFGRVIRRLIMGKRKKQQEYLAKRKDGSTFIMSVNFSLLKDSENNPKEIIAVHRDITKRKKAEHNIRERDKGLNCLYSVSKIVEKEFVEIEEILSKTVELIPPAWQFPEVTCARIVVDGQEYKTENYKDTNWKQSSNIIVNKEKIGVIEVIYLGEMPESDEGPFLKEERQLIDELTAKLGAYLERKKAEQKLENS